MVEDHVHARGFLGLTTNGSKGTMFDLLCFSALPVYVEPPLDDIKYGPVDCSRFKESYKVSKPNIVYETVLHPSSLKQGPSIWKYTKNLNGRKWSLC